MIEYESGTHFDPAVVDAFKNVDDATFELIAAEIQ
jgi:response regulator RpfG family c-di-GMP phosphodiesterase